MFSFVIPLPKTRMEIKQSKWPMQIIIALNKLYFKEARTSERDKFIINEYGTI